LATGFFINIPNARKYVILTAAHSLIDRDGMPYLNSKVEVSESLFLEPADSDVFVSASYKSNPIPEHDYGAILFSKELIDKNSTDHGCGFGFSLKLGYGDLRGSNIDVSGHFNNDPARQRTTSTGRCTGC
jgi:hypothetical protein